MEALHLETTYKRDYVDQGLKHEIRYKKHLIEFIEETVARKQRRYKQGYTRSYDTLILHLKKFCEQQQAILYIESVGEVFLDEFINYLEDENLKVSYIAHLLAGLKAMVARASKYNYCINPSYEDVCVEDERGFAVYLNKTEIVMLYYFERLTRIQRRCRDIFILACLTGLRFSDIATLSIEEFKGDYLIKRTQKTNADAVIPLHDIVKEIFNRYNGDVAIKVSIQQYNRMLKNICEKAGINEPVTYSFHKGGKLLTVTKQKWEMIGSHTARRSMICNMYLSGQFTIQQIMLVSAHTTEKSLKRYLVVSGIDLAKQMAGADYFRK